MKIIDGIISGYNILDFALLGKSLRICQDAHESIGQKRKYTGEPYYRHPLRVFDLIVNNCDLSSEQYNKILCAAALHDVYEDVFPKNSKYSLKYISEQFSESISNIVNEVSNRYTKEEYSWLNRDKRNNLEANRLAQTSYSAQTIKYADIIDNVSDIKINDPKFAPIYIEEKRNVLRIMKYGNHTLYKMACKEVGLC